METFWIKALQLVASLALLVVIHEFGHYIFARMFGIRVEKFYLFFNPWFSLFKWKPKEPAKRRMKADGTPKASWRDTEYGVGWLPLGGYCKIAGMIDESMDKEQMKQPAKPDEFRARPAYQRLLVMVGGVLFNLILACVIYVGIAIHWGSAYVPYENATEGMNFTKEALDAGYRDGDIILAADGKYVPGDAPQLDIAGAKTVTVLRDGHEVNITNPDNFPLLLEHGLFDRERGEFRLPAYVKQVNPGTPAAKAGFEAGDRVIAVDGVATPSYDILAAELQSRSGQPTEVALLRGSDTVVTTVTPEDGKLGFMLRSPQEIFDVKQINYNFFQAIPKGIGDGFTKLANYVTSLKYLFTKKGAQEIGGFGAIGNLFPEKWNWYDFWQMTAFLSIILAFMNILPIPALDGGHVMFVLWEIVTRKKPSEKFLERAQMVGMFLLIALLLYANGNDIYRFIFK